MDINKVFTLSSILLLIIIFLAIPSLALAEEEGTSEDFRILVQVLAPQSIEIEEDIDFGAVSHNSGEVEAETTAEVTGEPETDYSASIEHEDGIVFLNHFEKEDSLEVKLVIDDSEVGPLDEEGKDSFTIYATLKEFDLNQTAGEYSGIATVTIAYSD
ncbi:DUF4402 domain-containing protein [Fuchsiella alkaliacetigena]|nr:DUF4402 domain-containing protein [Fuchsiella alkaliacetigena]